MIKRTLHTVLACAVAAGLCLSRATGPSLCALAAQLPSLPSQWQSSWVAVPANTLMQHGILLFLPQEAPQPHSPIQREDVAMLLHQLALQFPSPPISSTLPELPPSQDIPRSKATCPSRSQPPKPPSFSDVSPQHRAYPAITYLANLGLFSPDSSGLFGLNQPITRGEYADLLFRFLSLYQTFEPLSQEIVFQDLDSSPYRESLLHMVQAQLFQGYPDQTIRPEELVSWEEAVHVIYQISGLDPIVPPGLLPSSRVISVPYISQVYPYSAWVGCEATSLLMGLQAQGYAQSVTLPQFLEAMPKSQSDPAKGFVGSPYVADRSKQTRTTIYPPILAQFGSGYGPVYDISGSSPQELQQEILAGNPVLVYVTMRWEPPVYREYMIEGEPQTLLSNNHAVLLAGYDPSQGYYVVDPYNVYQPDLELRYWKDAKTVEELYNLRRHAVVIRSTPFNLP